MVFQTKAGSFVLNTATGNQTISGVGFQPTGILFFSTGSTVEGTSAVDSRFSYGMTDGTTDHCATVTAEDGVATHTERRSNITQILNMMNAASAVQDITVTHVSMNSDGFVINIGANINSEAILVKYFAIGGTTNLVVGESAANAPGLTVTGLGFQPNLLLAMNSGQVAGSQTSMHGLYNVFGCAERFSGSTRQWRHVGFFGEDDRAQSSSSVHSDGFTGQVYNGGLTWSISLATFDTGGFTWTGTNADGFQYMAIELPTGIEAFAGVQTKVTGAAPATQTLPNSTFTPQSYILCNGHDTTTTPTQQSAFTSIGAYSQPGTASQFNVSVASEIAAGSQADCRADATNALIETALGGGTVAEAVPQTITDSTPDIIWDPNTATADFLGYLALESDPVTVVTQTHTTSSVLKAIDNTRTHTTDSVLKAIDNTRTHTTDSVLQAIDNLRTHTTDSVLEAGLVVVTLTHTTDSVLQAIDNLLTHTTDSVLQRIDAILTHTTDSFLTKRIRLTFTTDSVLQSIDNLLTHTTDSFLQATFTLTHTTDSVLKAIQTLTHTTDSRLFGPAQVIHTTDSLLKAIFSLTHTTDSELLLQPTKFHTTDSVLQSIDNLRTHLTDSVLKAIDTLRIHTTDSHLILTNLLSHTTDSLLKKIATLIHTTDSILSQKISLTHTTDSFLVKKVLLTFTTDSVFTKNLTLTHTTSSFVNRPGEALHTTDSHLKGFSVNPQVFKRETRDILTFQRDIRAVLRFQ